MPKTSATTPIIMVSNINISSMFLRVIPSVRYVPNSRFLSRSIKLVAYPSTNADTIATSADSIIRALFISRKIVEKVSSCSLYITLCIANMSETVSVTVIKYIR